MVSNASKPAMVLMVVRFCIHHFFNPSFRTLLLHFWTLLFEKCAILKLQSLVCDVRVSQKTTDLVWLDLVYSITGMI